MEVGAVKQAFNNEVIHLKKRLNQAKIQVIHKLTRKAKLLTDKRSTEAIQAKMKRKADSAVKEVMQIKKVTAKELAKFAVTHKGKLVDYLNQPIINSDRACARLLLHKVLDDKYDYLRSRYTDISIDDLMMSREERRKIKQDIKDKAKEKQRNKMNKNKNDNPNTKDVDCDLKRKFNIKREIKNNVESDTEDSAEIEAKKSNLRNKKKLVRITTQSDDSDHEEESYNNLESEDDSNDYGNTENSDEQLETNQSKTSKKKEIYTKNIFTDEEDSDDNDESFQDHSNDEENSHEEDLEATKRNINKINLIPKHLASSDESSSDEEESDNSSQEDIISQESTDNNGEEINTKKQILKQSDSDDEEEYDDDDSKDNNNDTENSDEDELDVKTLKIIKRYQQKRKLHSNFDRAAEESDNDDENSQGDNDSQENTGDEQTLEVERTRGKQIFKQNNEESDSDDEYSLNDNNSQENTEDSDDEELKDIKPKTIKEKQMFKQQVIKSDISDSDDSIDEVTEESSEDKANIKAKTPKMFRGKSKDWLDNSSQVSESIDSDVNKYTPAIKANNITAKSSMNQIRNKRVISSSDIKHTFKRPKIPNRGKLFGRKSEHWLDNSTEISELEVPTDSDNNANTSGVNAKNKGKFAIIPKPKVNKLKESDVKPSFKMPKIPNNQKNLKMFRGKSEDWLDNSTEISGHEEAFDSDSNEDISPKFNQKRINKCRESSSDDEPRPKKVKTLNDCKNMYTEARNLSKTNKHVENIILSGKNKSQASKYNKKRLEKLQSIREKQDLQPESGMKIADPFFKTSTGGNYMSLVEPRLPDEVKDIHQEGNRKLRRAAIFGHEPNYKPRKFNREQNNQFCDSNKFDRSARTSGGYYNKFNRNGPNYKNNYNKFEQNDKGRNSDRFNQKEQGNFGNSDNYSYKNQGNTSHQELSSNIRGNDIVKDKSCEKLHPSWEAKKRQSEILPFKGKKTIFI